MIFSCLTEFVKNVENGIFLIFFKNPGDIICIFAENVFKNREKNMFLLKNGKKNLKDGKISTEIRFAVSAKNLKTLKISTQKKVLEMVAVEIVKSAISRK
jgi:hypothetical protein